MSLISLTKEACRVSETYGIGLWQQFLEALRLRYGPAKLEPWEYYFFQVYLPKFSATQKQAFAGWRRELIIDRLTNHGQREIANNKLAFHQLMSDNGLPVPAILAVYSSATNIPADIIRLTDQTDLRALLYESAASIIKPIRGARGKNIFVCQRVSGNEMLISTHTGEHIELTALHHQLRASAPAGYVVQELLQTHPTIAAICGNRLTSARLIIINNGTGTEILSAVWRCPAGQNKTDNFDAGRKGNLIADIELTSGAIKQTIQGAGWRNIATDTHPDTRQSLAELTLPDWQQLTTTCLRAASLLPKLRLQHWDVAITQQGPVLLEVNVEGGMRTHQIVQQRGIVRAQLAALLEDCARTK